MPMPRQNTHDLTLAVWFFTCFHGKGRRREGKLWRKLQTCLGWGHLPHKLHLPFPSSKQKQENWAGGRAGQAGRAGREEEEDCWAERLCLPFNIQIPFCMTSVGNSDLLLWSWNYSWFPIIQKPIAAHTYIYLILTRFTPHMHSTVLEKEKLDMHFWKKEEFGWWDGWVETGWGQGQGVGGMGQWKNLTLASLICLRLGIWWVGGGGGGLRYYSVLWVVSRRAVGVSMTGDRPDSLTYLPTFPASCTAMLPSLPWLSSALAIIILPSPISNQYSLFPFPPYYNPLPSSQLPPAIWQTNNLGPVTVSLFSGSVCLVPPFSFDGDQTRHTRTHAASNVARNVYSNDNDNKLFAFSRLLKKERGKENTFTFACLRKRRRLPHTHTPDVMFLPWWKAGDSDSSDDGDDVIWQHTTHNQQLFLWRDQCFAFCFVEYDASFIY